MQDSKLKHSNKSTVIYPGISQQLSSDRKYLGAKEDKTKIPSVENSNSVVKSSARDIIKNVRDAGIEKSYFKLDWIDYKQSDTTSVIQAKTEKNTKSGLSSVPQKNEKKSSDRVINRTSFPYSSSFGKTQFTSMSNHQTSIKPNSSRHLDGNDSTALDMSNELTNESSGDYFDNQNLDGQLTEGEPEVKQSLSSDYNQLDEPIMDTLLRDLTGIYKKMKIIALPLSSYEIYKVVLRGWDLWGPLLLCTFLAFNLHHSSGKDKYVGPHFADVFVLVWVGSCIISLNYRLLSIASFSNQVTVNQPFQVRSLQQSADEDNNQAKTKEDGGNFNKVSPSQEPTFQTLMSPPSIFQLMCVFGYCLVAPCFGLVLLKLFAFNRLLFERIIVGLLFGFAWPTFCSVRILIRYQHPDKRALAIYPIGLFYFILSCMIILNH